MMRILLDTEDFLHLKNPLFMVGFLLEAQIRHFLHQDIIYNISQSFQFIRRIVCQESLDFAIVHLSDQEWKIRKTVGLSILQHGDAVGSFCTRCGGGSLRGRSSSDWVRIYHISLIQQMLTCLHYATLFKDMTKEARTSMNISILFWGTTADLILHIRT